MRPFATSARLLAIVSVTASVFALAMVSCGTDETQTSTDGAADAADAADASGNDGGGERAPKDASQSDTASGSTRDAALEGGDADAAQGCMPLRHYVFTSAADVALGCDGNAPVTIIDTPVADVGHAVGRATFTVHHTGANTVTHFWNLQVQVGAPVDAYGLGDDVCPGTSSARANLGFGALGAAASHAKLVGYSGAAPCTPGTLVVDAGATLEVWVEDARAECVGKDMAFASYYAVNGVSTYYDWTTSFTTLPGVTAALTTTAPTESLRVLGVVEGSPGLDPNTTCGSEVATIDLETALDGVPMAQIRNVVPASQGMGHRVLFTTGDGQELRPVTPGMHTAALHVASDFIVAQPVTTGGCCGDGEVALLRIR
jgi:hypothetical protein